MQPEVLQIFAGCEALGLIPGGWDCPWAILWSDVWDFHSEQKRKHIKRIYEALAGQ